MQNRLPMVFNCHITEKCNYRCYFCFAKWGNSEKIELWKDTVAFHKLIDELSDKEVVSGIFGESGRPNRINFAGGEPLLLGHKFLDIVKHAKEKELETSIITNGSLLNTGSEIYKYIDLLGISVDSLNVDTCRQIGRCDRFGKVLEYKRLREVIAGARAINPDIRVKFNVTVNRYNYNERIIGRLQLFSPDRIKILRQLPFNGVSGISDEMFSEFMRLNESDLGKNTVVEDNEDMTQSYLMIDPYGRFFQNGNGHGYTYSDPIHEVGLEKALSQIDFDVDKFGSRYETIDKKEVVMKTDKITISGYAGTGKSTVGKMLAKKLGYRFLSVGNFAREFAENEFGISINEFQAKCEKEPRLDDFVNLKFRDLCNGNESVVADFRLGFHFVENAVNILFVLPEEEAFKRLVGAGRRMEQTDFESVKIRNKNMRRRFMEKYGVDFADANNYDLVIDTSRKTPDEVVGQIFATVGERFKINTK